MTTYIERYPHIHAGARFCAVLRSKGYSEAEINAAYREVSHSFLIDDNAFADALDQVALNTPDKTSVLESIRG